MKREDWRNLLAHRVTLEFQKVNVTVAICFSPFQSICTHVCNHLIVLTNSNVLHYTTLISEYKSEEFFGSDIKGTFADSDTESFHRVVRLRRIVVGTDDAHGAVQGAATQQLSCPVPTDTKDTSARFVSNNGSGISPFLLLLLLHTETAWMDPEILIRVEGTDTDYRMKDSNRYVFAHSTRRQRLFRWETTCSTTRLA